MSDLFGIELLITLVVIGYLAGLPVLIWALTDGRTISRRVWAACGRRRSRWEQQLFVGYACAGWPVIVIALLWKTGRLRHELRRERTFERERGRY